MKNLIGALASVALLATGCGIPISKTTVMPEGVAKDTNQLTVKLDELKNKYIGVDVSEVSRALGIKAKTPGVRDIIKAQEKKDILYAGFEIRGTHEEAEAFRKHLERHSIKEIVFSDTVKTLTLDSPVSALTTKNGPEFVAYLIFFDNKLVEVRKPENFHKKEKSRVYVTELLGGALGGGLSQGLKQIR